jgi:adenylate kinase
MRLILFGPPGVGKGTQAKLLASEFGVPHISTGDVLRAAAHRGTDLGRKAKTIMDTGHLVPDDVMIAIVREELGAPPAKDGFILDGFPRTLPQAKALARIFADLDIRKYRVIEFDVDDEEIVRRLGSRVVCPKDGHIYNAETDGLASDSACPECGTHLVQRADDAEETVRKRLRVYHLQTAPVIHFYEELGVVMKVDGTGSIDVVNREIKMLLHDTTA